MTKWDRFGHRLLSKSADKDSGFVNLCHYVEIPGVEAHPNNDGSHHIFASRGVAEIMNLQPERNSAKAYQVRQVRSIIIKYEL